MSPSCSSHWQSEATFAQLFVLFCHLRAAGLSGNDRFRQFTALFTFLVSYRLVGTELLFGLGMSSQNMLLRMLSYKGL